MTAPVPDRPTAHRGQVEDVVRAVLPHADDDEVAGVMARIDRAARAEGRYRARAVGRGAVMHLDGNPYNNDPANLRVVDPRENSRDHR